MTFVRLFSGVMVVGSVAGNAAAQDSFNDFFWSPRMTTGLDYSAGKYGDTRTTEIAYVPLTAQTARGPWTFKLATGWLTVSGPALILDGAGEASTTPGVSRSASGFADTSFSVMYSLEHLYDRGVYLDLSARAKLPSASFAKGLGTGRVDGALQADLAIALGNVMPFVTVGYKANGVRDALKLRNVGFGSFGVQYAWDERVSTGIVYDYRQASRRTSKSPREGSVYLSHRFSEAWSYNLYAVVGFSTNSPSAGGGLTFTYRFAPSESPLPFGR
jgi:hypothetical protein